MMKRLHIIAIIVMVFTFLASCKLPQPGMVMMTDPSYKASMFLTNANGITSPEGLLWHKGKLYIADEGGVALEVWSKEDGLKTLLDASFGTESPERLVMDSDENIFFTDDDAGGLWEVDAQGNRWIVAYKDKGLISTKGIALAPDGSLLVGDEEQHEVFRVTKDGEVSVFLGKEFGITKPSYMVYDDQGNLYIGDNLDHVLYLLDSNHVLHRLIDRQESFSPEEMCYFKGSLYITDAHNGKLYVYNAKDDLKTIAAFGGRLKIVHGVTIDDEGNIYVAVQTDLKQKVGHIIKISKDSTEIAQK